MARTIDAQGRTLAQLAQLVDGRVWGDPQQLVYGVAPIDEAQSHQLTFLARSDYTQALSQCQAKAVLTAQKLDNWQGTQLLCQAPYAALAAILEELYPEQPPKVDWGSHPQVAPDAQLGADVVLAPGSVVMSEAQVGAGGVLYPGAVVYPRVRLGAGCVLHAGAVVREDCVLGDRVVLGPNAVVGSDGFGYTVVSGQQVKIPQVGRVEVGADVEIGAGSCVDRATLGVTRIGDRCKLDNMVQVGHNVTIGADTVLAAQTGISGSTRIGSRCAFGGQAATAGHMQVGDDVTVAGRGGVTGDAASGDVLAGTPAIPLRRWRRAVGLFAKLPDLFREVQRLRQEVAKVQRRQEGDKRS